MLRFKLGFVLGLAVGWAVASGKAAEVIERLKSAGEADVPGAVASRVPRPVFDRSGESTAVSA